MLNLNGIRKLIGTEFMNKGLEEARDLWILSFCLAGLDIREILATKKEDVMPGIFLAQNSNDSAIPLPLPEHANKIFQKYEGKYYALKFIEANGAPLSRNAQKMCSHLLFDLNRRMDFITKTIELGIRLPFENARIMWMLLARNLDMDQKVINLMSNFTVNTNGRNLASGKLERVAKANNLFIDKIFGIEQGLQDEAYPRKLPDGSILLFEC